MGFGAEESAYTLAIPHQGNELKARETEFQWLLATHLPAALSEIAVCLQDALDLLQPPNTAALFEDVLLLDRTGTHEAGPIRAQATFSGYFMTRFEASVKVSALRHATKLPLSLPAPVVPLLNSHHHVRSCLQLLQNAMPPFAPHAAKKIMTSLDVEIQKAQEALIGACKPSLHGVTDSDEHAIGLRIYMAEELNPLAEKLAILRLSVYLVVPLRVPTSAPNMVPTNASNMSLALGSNGSLFSGGVGGSASANSSGSNSPAASANFGLQLGVPQNPTPQRHASASFAQRVQVAAANGVTGVRSPVSVSLLAPYVLSPACSLSTQSLPPPPQQQQQNQQRHQKQQQQQSSVQHGIGGRRSTTTGGTNTFAAERAVLDFAGRAWEVTHEMVTETPWPRLGAYLLALRATQHRIQRAHEKLAFIV